MARDKPASERSVRYPRRWRQVAGWSAGLLAAVLVLGATGYLVGRPKPAKPTGLVDTLAAVAGRPTVALAIACAALLHTAWCVRRLILHWLAWWPGLIEVATLTAGTPITDANAEQLTLGFRQRLMALHLQSPTPVPGAAAEGDFLDVLGRNGLDARNPLATLIGLLRAAKPTHAYEVRGVLMQRAEIPRCGVAVRVLRLPSDGTPPVTTWGETWEIALRKAADEATAMILPQTRLCRAPWGAWRGYVMPPGLLHAFEEGARLERERRYDEALATYWRAVELDPLNMVLRLRVGQLQERLGLYLDAFATYWGMSVTSPPLRRANRLRGRRANRLRGRRGRLERDHALLSARYRRNVLLGGRVLAKQWVAIPDEECGANRRDEQREHLRRCLRPLLQEELEDFDEAPRVARALADVERIEQARFHALRTLFAQYALRDCTRMRNELRRRDRATLTAETVQLTELCIGWRLDWVLHTSARLRDRPTTVQWPPATSDIERIQRSERRRSWHWHEHYNAACAYALPLLDESLSDIDRLAERAVDQLKRATARADSDYIASRRDWVLSQDPALKGLRGRHEFEQFQFLYLPSDRPVLCRPRNVQQLESSRYVRELLVATAGRWLQAWRAHGTHAAAVPDITVVREWFDDERRAWDGLRDVALNFRHLRTRFELIQALRAGAARHGFARPAVRFPRYEDEPLLDPTTCEVAYEAEITGADDRLRRMAALADDVVADLASWQATLRSLEADGRPAPRYALTLRCVHHAALWQLLADWLEARGKDASGRAEAELRARVARVPRDVARNGTPRTTGVAIA
jgi:tetratricopeptide (TPR) repeat protein